MYKSQWTQFFLTFIFGPIGLFYSNVTAAIGVTTITIAAISAVSGNVVVIWPIFSAISAVGGNVIVIWPIFAVWSVSIITGMYYVTRHNELIDYKGVVE